MAAFGELVVIYDLLPELAAALEEQVSKAVRKAAFDIAATAMAGPPRDTGFLKNSIYCEVHGPNKYPYGSIPAPERQGSYLLPEVDKPHKPTEAVVAVGANYGLYVEYGTSHMAAQPYLTPAVEKVAPQFLHALEKLEEAMAAGAGSEV